jgi:aryl-alcohol dehydrogenase-like predicted oxidoreductase
MAGKWWGPSDDDTSVRTIHAALDAGVNLIDTAEGYGNGHAEEIVGRALNGRRSEAVIATKVSQQHLTHEQIETALKDSCQRMQTDYVDIYFIHWPNPAIPIGGTLETLTSLKESGRIGAIGASNFSVKDLEIAGQFGTIDVVQPPFNMFWRSAESGLFDYCSKNGIGTVGYSGLAQGLLTGHIDRSLVLAEGDERHTTVLFQPGTFENCVDAVAELRTIAERYDKSVTQLAINWLTRRVGLTSALLGMRTEAEVAENVGGLGWDVSDADRDAIEAISKPIWDSVSHNPDMFGRWRQLDSGVISG